jgi:hypothetical protein
VIALDHFLFRERHPGALLTVSKERAWKAPLGKFWLFRIVRRIDQAWTFPFRLALGIAQRLAVRRMRRRYPRLA